jgi:hypothetical protein
MRFLSVIFLFLSLCFKAQVNFVGNPSFEIFHSGCTGPNFVSKLKYWGSLDSSYAFGAGPMYHTCYSNVPYAGPGLYQSPKTGNSFIRTTFYCTTVTCTYNNSRIYPKNRMLTTLTSGATYCVKMWANLQNNSPYAIDALHVYFGDVSLDTIKYCMTPLTYLTPQITNTVGIINDTLNWIEISETFVANGTEKYLVIGNFKTDAVTSGSSTPTGFGGGVWSEYMLDDVSVIDFNLPASAGPDKNIFLGDSAFIGRPPEIGLECTWSSGTVSVGTGGGLWVKPTSPGTYSYVVTQNICGNIKTDTVNVNVSPSSINENTLFSNSISIYPQPASELVTISLNYFYEKSIEVRVLDVNGKLVREGALGVRSGKAEIQISDLADGVYAIQLKNSSGQWAVKRLVVAR